MKRLVACVLAACADDGGGELPVDTWPGEVTWTWAFSDGGPCPAEVTTANIYIASYDRDAFAVRNEPFISRSVPCARGTAMFPLSNPLGIGRMGHDTWVELTTADGRVFARSQLANTRDENATPSAVFEVPRGWVRVAWTLVDQTSQRVLSCDDLGPNGEIVLYEATPTDQVLQPTLDVCTRGEMWLGLAPGTYDLALATFSALSFNLGETSNTKLFGKHSFDAVQIAAGETVELGTHPLPILDQ